MCATARLRRHGNFFRRWFMVNGRQPLLSDGWLVKSRNPWSITKANLRLHLKKQKERKRVIISVDMYALKAITHY